MNKRPGDRNWQKTPVYRAVLATEQAITKWEPNSPETGARARTATVQMRQALVAGYSHPPGTPHRVFNHRQAWHYARQLDAMIRSELSAEDKARELKQLQRAVDCADVFLSSLPGVAS